MEGKKALRTALERLLFVSLLVGLGHAIAGDRGALLGAVAGAIAAIAPLWIRTLPTNVLIGGTAGLLLGVLAALLTLLALGGLDVTGLDLPGVRDTDLLAIKVLIVGVLAYIGTVVGMRRAVSLSLEGLPFLSSGRDARKAYKIIDTSVIIDGRIVDIAAAGFLDGTLVIPQFVLRELQQVADSADALKRNRGRRGLEILKGLKQGPDVSITFSDIDYADLREVDHKLIELARHLGGKIVTTDFNLNKVAELRGVEVLNINQLANAVKPAVLVGEVMRVFVLKEGKELTQGVAYLDDGTMVVVDSARKAIGKTIDVVVTSIHQTTAGKMIFGRFEGGPLTEGNATGPGTATSLSERREWRRRSERGQAPAPAVPDKVHES